MLKEFEFGPEAILYIRAHLPEWNTLGGHLLALPLESGRVRAYLPERIAPETAAQFEWGGLTEFLPELDLRFGKTVMTPIDTQPERIEIKAKVVSFISAYLREAEDRVAVFIDTIWQPDDKHVRTSPLQFVVHDQELYFFVTPEDASATTISSAMRVTPFWASVAALTRATEGIPPLRDRETITADSLRLLAENSEYLLVVAYDGEAELIWSRS